MPDARALSTCSGGKPHPDAVIAELAGRQQGVVAVWQLLELGLGRRAIEHRVACGRLHRIHRGVYAVGHTCVSRTGRLMAAVLAVGGDGVLGVRDAGDLWGVRPCNRSRIEVIVARPVRSRPGIQVRRMPLRHDEVTQVDGIPVTTVPRTLLDLAAVLDRRQLTRAVHEAEVRQLWHALSLADLVERYPRRAGVPALRAVLHDLHRGLSLTRNDVEAAFLDLVERAGLPRPEVNALLHLDGVEIEPDFLWRDWRLVVEVDGGRVHRTARNFESDRRRDRRLQAAGFRVVRVTAKQVEDEPAAVAPDLISVAAQAATDASARAAGAGAGVSVRPPAPAGCRGAATRAGAPPTAPRAVPPPRRR